MPENQEQWMNISNDFMDLWNFSRAVGALDGKHIVMQRSFKSGSQRHAEVIQEWITVLQLPIAI
jgi:hypothetical protein